MSLCCECCVSSGKGLCDELINRPEESYRVCPVFDLKTSIMRRRMPELSCCAAEKIDKNVQVMRLFVVLLYPVCCNFVRLRPIHFPQHTYLEQPPLNP